MFPDEIIDILEKYKNDIAEETLNINLSIEKIKCELNSVNSVISEKLKHLINSNEISDKEIELLNDSRSLRKYIHTINTINFDYNINEDVEQERQLDIFSLIVLSNTLKCSFNHETIDVIANIPVMYSDEDIRLISVCASYCKECRRYTMLKDDFKKITGIIMCKVIDETTTSTNTSLSELGIEPKNSILYQYGYNVKSKIDLPDKERHIILASLVEAKIATRMQIMDHLTILIERGSKRQNWKEATEKWKQDKYFVQSYKTENLPNVIFDKIILGYSKRAGE